MNTNKAKANGNVCLFFLKSFRNGQWSVSGRVRDLTEKSCFVRAGVAVFLIGYKKDVLQGEVYPLSQEEEVNNFVQQLQALEDWLAPRCRAVGAFNTFTLSLPAVASGACKLLGYGIINVFQQVQALEDSPAPPWRAAGAFNTFTLSLPAVASGACNLLV